jgi:sensor c-di-GMP phosphodiesterase-like protein
MLERFDVSAGQLELEMTETALMDDVERSMATLKRFRDLGLTLAEDDFGTGYSSLAYLKALPKGLKPKPGRVGWRYPVVMRCKVS